MLALPLLAWLLEGRPGEENEQNLHVQTVQTTLPLSALAELPLHLSAHEGEEAKGISCHVGPMKGETETWPEWGGVGEESREHTEPQGLSAPIVSSSSAHSSASHSSCHRSHD